MNFEVLKLASLERQELLDRIYRDAERMSRDGKGDPTPHFLYHVLKAVMGE